MNHRTLLIEDNPGDVRLFSEALALAQITTSLTVIDNGESALTKLNNFDDPLYPHMVFLDLNLPKHSGFEILSVVKQAKRNLDTPIIVITSAVVQREFLRAYECGANCVITKPFELDSYLATMSLALTFWHAVTSAGHPDL